MEMKRTAAFLMAFALLGALASTDAAEAKKGKRGKCAKACATQCKASKDIVQTAKADGSFKTLSGALHTTGLSKTLEQCGPYTVFAPNDEAFNKLPKETRAALLTDAKHLAQVLKYHVVKGSMTAADLAQKRSVPTVEGESLMVDSKPDGNLIVDGALVTKSDIKCCNGVIHVIDYPLSPERGK